MDRQQQVRVHLKRVTNLPPDDGLLGSCTCDPYVVMEVHGATKTPRAFRSKIVPFTLNPAWSEHVYVLTLTETERERCILHVRVYDHNDVLPDSVVGDAHVHLGELGNGIHHQVHLFPLSISSRRRRGLWTKSQVELAFDVVTHSPTKECIQLEAWENQRFSFLHRVWSKEFLEPRDPAPWTSDASTRGGATIADVACAAPSGFVSRVGWYYDVRLGDDNGWHYARTFAGPWQSHDGPTMFVRQRLWLNACTKQQADIS
ncbi:Aste57867_16554 [Aphanomyces stellatus]|uniref:Aste57867_16554 protein n=1 Tax=Aphanomyces stellatus TaxID=120398 RepID=A0A485L6Q0_9STRA|nr:hypothetical protein As57867_016497 [Aphanomyces stellatus]VFT93328.1 Aste57867_16554 [Aphanomyces stellatus]